MVDKKFLKKDIKASFNKAASTYDSAAFFQNEVADRLLERLNYIKLNPAVILDLGAGTGYSIKKLEQRYKKAKLIALDLAENMLHHAKQEKKWFDRKRFICSDAESLPFKNESVDLIFSNLMLHWCNNIPQAIAEIHRILKPDGLLLFSTLGPDTLFELRESWQKVDQEIHVHSFSDMHLLGDELQRSQFKDPVMDMEYITVHYNDVKKIFLDLKDLGTQNIATQRVRGLTGKKKFDRFVHFYEQLRNEEGFIPLTYEVVYGTAWGKKKVDPTEISIPISEIKRIK